MYPFKSRKTYERLYLQHPAEPKLEFDSQSHIDQKFNEFASQYARKELSISQTTHFKEEIPLKPNEKPIEKLIEKPIEKPNEPITKNPLLTRLPREKTVFLHKKVQFTEVSEPDPLENPLVSDEERLWTLLEGKIKENLKKKDKENPLVKYFKNPLIAAVIESLIVKTIENTFKIKLNLENSEEMIPANLMKLFNISQIALSTMSTKHDKLNYVVSCMAKNVENSLEKFDQKIQNQDKKSKEFLEKFIEEKNIANNEQKDIFEWLQIKTKYQFLKKSLRTSIIEKLNHVLIQI